MRLFVALIALLFASTNALGQVACGEIKGVLASLAAKYHEVILFSGMLHGATPAMIYANASTGTWTVFVQPTPNMLCIILSGDGFKIPEMPKGTPL